MKSTTNKRPRATERETKSGHCPVCMHVQKLAGGERLVYHGFQRPGYGSTVGGCFGEGHLAYEISDEGCREYRKTKEAGVLYWHSEIQRLRKATELTVTRRDRDNNFIKTVVRFGDPTWERALTEELRKAEWHLKGERSEINCMDSLLKLWRRKPVLTELEAVESKNTPEKVAARDARAEAKAAKEAKKKAAADKHNAKIDRLRELVPQRDALVASFRAELDKLAESPSDENRIRALKILREVIKPRNQKFGEIWVAEVTSKFMMSALFPKGYYLNESDAVILERQRQ